MPSTVLDGEPMEDDSAHSSGHSKMTPTASSADDVEMNEDPASEIPTPGEEEAEAGEGASEKKDTMALEDLFDDASDEEFPSSAPVKGPEPSVSADPAMDVAKMKASDPEVMRSFYQRLFPWRQLFQWLNHSPTPTNDFRHREFAFELPNAFVRFQSYANSDQLRRDVLRMMPSRFEIGPTYSTDPRDRKTLRNASSFRPLAKELCFDIDLTDYDDVRTCCDKANICDRCWRFVTMAIKVVDAALREDFGFRHIMWVYSGRRGAHAWVCDRKARELEDQRRRAVAGYLEVIRGGAQSAKKVNVKRPLHPHLARSLDILKTHFQDDVLSAQNPWESSEQAEKLLQLLPDRTLNESLRRKWDAAPGRSSASKWADIDVVAKSGASKNLDAKALLEAKQDIVLEYTYPRLDIEVSKKMSHLLKSPFVVHPKTGRVCVPIDTRSLEDFNPLTVPTVQGLLAEIDAWTAEDHDAIDDDDDDEKAKTTVADWEKTSLKPYVDYFRSFVNGIMRDEGVVKAKRERDEEGILDF